MRMIFDIKQQYLIQKSRLVIKVHVVDLSEHTTYSSNIKDISVIFMLMIAVKNGLKLMAGYIGNAFCTAPCAEIFILHATKNLAQNLVLLLFQSMHYMDLRPHLIHSIYYLTTSLDI